jgi:hypothetical protein
MLRRSSPCSGSPARQQDCGHGDAMKSRSGVIACRITGTIDWTEIEIDHEMRK